MMEDYVPLGTAGLFGVNQRDYSELFENQRATISSYATSTSTEWSMSLANIAAEDANSTAVKNITRDEKLARIEILEQTVVFVLALIGNLCVLVTLWRKRRTMTRMHVFIMHLSIADLISIFFGVLPQLIWDITFEFMAPDFVCRLMKYVQVVGMYLPTYVLVMTALDRYMAICHPMSGMKGTRARVRFMIGTAWMMSLAFSIPQIFIFNLVYITPDFTYCKSQSWFVKGQGIYTTCVAVLVYFLPTIILAWAYGMIWREVWRNAQLKSQWENKGQRPTYVNSHAHSYSNSLRNGDLQSNARGNLMPRTHYAGRGITKAKIKMAKMTLVIVIVYFLCWTPFFAVQLWMVWDTNPNIEAPLVVTLQIMATLNSCTNPWIYMAFSGNLLHELKRLCCGRRISLFGRSGTMNYDYRYGSARFYKTAVTRTGSCTTPVSLMHRTACVNFAGPYHSDGDIAPAVSTSSDSQSRARDSSSSLPITPTKPEPKVSPASRLKKVVDRRYVEMFTSV
ncbi:mesotocin receptor-like [Ptychodera flava]|uniref:mesotocin receptor-like n=1 Tax=Ptychodera flava TaxID=63121 RepID=UPI003969FBB6